MEKKFKGIVLAKKDYKDADSIITVLTVEEGPVDIQLKGVKKPKAKMKYAKEVFSFGVFDVVKNKSFYILTSCEIIDNFYDISQNPEKYLEACCLVSIAKSVATKNEQNLKLFFDLADALKTLCYENVGQKITLAKFLMNVFEMAGYKINFSVCSNCGMQYAGKKYYTNGEIVCMACATPYALPISEGLFANLRILSNTETEKIKNIKLANIDEVLKFLGLYFEEKFGFKFQLYC